MAVEGEAEGFFDSSNDILMAEQRENKWNQFNEYN